MTESASQIKNIALVTGGSSGIGKSVVEKLMAHNYSVVNADITAELANDDSRYFFKKTDITIGEQVQQLFDYVQLEVGLPNVLICNAGKGLHEKLSEGDPEKWFNVINLNLMGTLRILRSFLPGLLDQPHSHIIIISSVSSTNPYEYGGIYSATKAALDMIAETLRLELKSKTKVTIISPGIVDTNFFNNLESGELDLKTIGFGALKPNDVADAIMFALNAGSGTTINQIILRPDNQIF
jgi:NADP-dependent 3-hydroxy acid dehydrogenase YdfG